MRTRALILHDGAHISLCVQKLKDSEEFEVVILKSIENFVDVIQQWSPQLVIIDCHPFIREVVKMVINRRQQASFGFMIIARTYNLNDELFAYEADADHYLLSSTPFESFRIRAQKISSRVQVSRTFSLPKIIPQDVQIRFNNLIILPDEQIVKVGDQIIRLSVTEFKLLLAFTGQPEKILTRDWLKSFVWPKKNISHRSIDAQITKLKRRIPGITNNLVSVYGRGYILTTRKIRSA